MLKRVFRMIFSFTNKIQRKGGKPLQIKDPPANAVFAGVCNLSRGSKKDATEEFRCGLEPTRFLDIRTYSY